MPDKDREIWYLNRFLQTLRDAPSSGWNASEEPDFLADTDSGKVGIELVRFFVDVPGEDRPRQEQESIKSSIVGEAKRILDGMRLPNVQVNVTFSLSSSLTKRDVKYLGNAIATAVLSHLPPENGYLTIARHGTLSEPLPSEIAYINVIRSASLTRNYVYFDDVAFTPKVEPREIQAIIDSKESKIPAYAKQADELWLLIVIDGGELSSVADFPQRATKHSYGTTFDRVFLFFNAHMATVELSIDG